jgi:hypothetical protein
MDVQDLPYMVITSPEYFVGSDVAIIGDRGSFVVGTEGVSSLDLAGSAYQGKGTCRHKLL